MTSRKGQGLVKLYNNTGKSVNKVTTFKFQKPGKYPTVRNGGRFWKKVQ